MQNTLLNAVLAIIEDRPEDARVSLADSSTRTPASREILKRVYKTLEQRKNRQVRGALREILVRSLHWNTPIGGPEFQNGYLAGMCAVEKLVQQAIDDLGEER
jgi:hypothetical protein